MATTPPSDPYQVLGVDVDADSAAIKKAYRKLVLSCHPDKVVDPSLKAQKQEEFHKIQQAYETIGDSDKRTKYDLELKAKRLREERDRANHKPSAAPYRNVNINIFTAQHPSERRSSSRSSPPRPSSQKPYSSEFAKSWEQYPIRSRTYPEEKNSSTRQTRSDERLNDDVRDQARRDDDRERDRRRRQEEEEHDRRKRRARRERENAERDLQQQERAREAAKKREEKEREEYAREKQRADMKAKDRANGIKRRQEAADEKVRAEGRIRSQATSDNEDDRKSWTRSKPVKKDSPRDKTPSKPRERPSPRDKLPPPEILSTEEAVQSKYAFAAQYIQHQRAKKNSKSSGSKHTVDAPSFSEAYPDPKNWVPPKRRVSGEKPTKAAAAEPIVTDTASPQVSSNSQQQGPPPPRLQKSHTTGAYAPPPPQSLDARPPSLGRAQTFAHTAFSRASMGGSSERPRLSRQRTAAVDETDYYSAPAPARVQTYSVRADKGGMPRTVIETTQYDVPYNSVPTAAAPFSKVRTTPPYGVEQTKPYNLADIAVVDYYSSAERAERAERAYVAAHM